MDLYRCFRLFILLQVNYGLPAEAMCRHRVPDEGEVWAVVRHPQQQATKLYLKIYLKKISKDLKDSTHGIVSHLFFIPMKFKRIEE